jgi:hypothetical protein
MLTEKSEKTSLRDLTIAEIRRVSWRNIDPSEFVEDFNDLTFLARVNYADPGVVANWVDWGGILSVMHEAALEFVISSKKQRARQRRFQLDSDMWSSQVQFSADFLKRNARYLYLNGAVYQRCITPEFLDEFRDQISYNHFFDRFLQYRDGDEALLHDFLVYKDGMFRRWIMQSKGMRYLTRAGLESMNQPVPEYYDTVIDEQRIMSGQPCDDGQRSFTIWLRKFRRVTGRPNDYPTWNEMLTLMKSHPRLNHNGYVDWIMGRCLENSPETVAQYPERLSYRPNRVERESYTHITGVNEAQGEADFQIEFADVLDPTGSTGIDATPESDDEEGTEVDDSTDRVEDAAPNLFPWTRAVQVDGIEVSQRVQPMQPMNRFMPRFMNVSVNFDGDTGTEPDDLGTDEGSESES